MFRRTLTYLLVALSLALTGCASAAPSPAPSQPTAVQPTKVWEPPAKSKGTIVRVSDASTRDTMKYLGIRKDGETAWKPFVCNDPSGAGICYLVKIDDKISYDDNGAYASNIEIAVER